MSCAIYVRGEPAVVAGGDTFDQKEERESEVKPVFGHVVDWCISVSRRFRVVLPLFSICGFSCLSSVSLDAKHDAVLGVGLATTPLKP